VRGGKKETPILMNEKEKKKKKQYKAAEPVIDQGRKKATDKRLSKPRKKGRKGKGKEKKERIDITGGEKKKERGGGGTVPLIGGIDRGRLRTPVEGRRREVPVPRNRCPRREKGKEKEKGNEGGVRAEAEGRKKGPKGEKEEKKALSEKKGKGEGDPFLASPGREKKGGGQTTREKKEGTFPLKKGGKGGVLRSIGGEE